MEPIRTLKARHPKTGDVSVVTASPHGFFNLIGGMLACGRCGGTVNPQFEEQHFEYCRRLFRRLPEDSRIVTLGGGGT